MSWLRRFAEKNKPQHRSHLGFIRPLLQTRWFAIGLSLRYRSDSSFDQKAECSRLTVVLEGECTVHTEIPRLGRMTPAVRLPKDTFVYGNDDGLWAARRMTPGTVRYERVGHRGGVELHSARTTGEKLVDFPNWMQHKDVVFDSERQVFSLMVVWGGVW